MEHPFLSSSTLKDKSLDEIQTTISDLSTKLNFAYRTGNSSLISQLRMVIESYRTEYQRKMEQMVSKQNIQNRINIKKEG